MLSGKSTRLLMESAMTKSWIFAVLSVSLWIPCVANAEPNGDKSRGELLYTTHCIACHNDQIHWRDKKIAKDWIGLKAQVSHWQGVAGLAWSDSDIEEVARYLNVRHYHYTEHVQ
jgi:mono/diheme cytochrome c family protein